MKRIITSLLAITVLIIGAGKADALSSYVTMFKSAYPAAATSSLAACVLCHINPGGGGTRNGYGNAFLAAAHNYRTIESADSDADGFTNIAEITALTFPGNAASHPVAADATPPTVGTFTVPSTSTSLTVSGISIAATDSVGVTGYIITESAAAPAASAAGWSVSALTSYTAATAGAKTLFAYAKDAAGNVSAGKSAPVTINIVTADTTPPVVTTFTIPATSTSLLVNVSILTASDNVGVTGYQINESATAPLASAAGWAATAPSSYTFATAGAKTLRAYVKDAAGNVSAGKSAPVTITLSNPNPVQTSIGVFLNGVWFIDANGDGVWDPAVDTTYHFGKAGDIPVVGDWNGDGKAKIGVFRITAAGQGVWLLDMDGNGTWNSAVDARHVFGHTGDIPVVGDWNGDGKGKIGVFRITAAGQGVWFLDIDGNGTLNTAVDARYVFGHTGDIPVVGDWNGDGKTKVGVFRINTAGAGVWFLDIDGNGTLNTAVDARRVFGHTGDVPVVGDWNATGKTAIGVYRQGQWIIDYDGNGVRNPADMIFTFGQAVHTPVTK